MTNNDTLGRISIFTASYIIFIFVFLFFCRLYRWRQGDDFTAAVNTIITSENLALLEIIVVQGTGYVKLRYCPPHPASLGKMIFHA